MPSSLPPAGPPPPAVPPAPAPLPLPRPPSPDLADFERGVVVGLLISQGSFGGDGRQPQITLRMHTRHEALLRWLVDRFPRTRLYGPYGHGGRSYLQWIARGEALVLDVLPLLEGDLPRVGDGHALARLEQMCSRYAGFIARTRSRVGREPR